MDHNTQSASLFVWNRFSRRWSATFLLFTALLSSRGAEHEVMVDNYDFMPERLTINVGDTVVWVAYAPDHTVSADDGSFDSIPIEDSIPVGGSFKHTFTTPGTYSYYCAAHGGSGGTGMAGVIVVRASTLNQPPARPNNLLPVADATKESTAPSLTASPFSDPDAGDYHTASQWIIRNAANNMIVFDSGTTATQLSSIQITGLGESTTYAWQVRYRDSQNAWSEYSLPTRFTTAEKIAEKGTGLRGQFSNAPDLAAPLWPATNSALNFDWGSKRPHRRITAERFSARWDGYLVPPFSETYEFQVEGKGGVRLAVNGVVVVDDEPSCGSRRVRRARVALTAEKPVRMQLDFFSGGGESQLAVRWSSASILTQIIPAERLFAPGALPGYE